MSVWLNHWTLACPSWHRQLTITVPVKCFFLRKIPTFALWLLHFAVHLCFLWDTLYVGSKISEAYRYCGHDRELPGKKEYLLKSLKCKMPSSDLWSSGVWGLVQTWAGRTISLFWSLSVPHPGKPGVRLSDVSVWVTVVSCSRLPTPCRTGGLHTGEWFLIWPKVLWNLHETSLSHSQGEKGGACSASSSDPHIVSLKKSKVPAGGEWCSHCLSHVWSSAASS